MKIRANVGDQAFAFGIAGPNGKFSPYYVVIRKSGAVYLECLENELVHISLHLPKQLTPGFADCHYSVPKELVKTQTVEICGNNGDRKYSKWQRKIGTHTIEAALHLLFPEPYSSPDTVWPSSGMIEKTQIEKFEVGMLAGLQSIVTVYDARIKRLVKSAGCEGYALGTPRKFGKVTAYAGLFPTDTGMLRSIRSASGFHGSVLRSGIAGFGEAA